MTLAIINADAGNGLPSKLGFYDATDIAAQIGDQGANPALADAPVTPSPTVIPDGLVAAPLRAFAEIFYFRVWALPAVLDVQNPQVGQPIEFKLWNAFLVDNELTTIVETDTTGVTIDVVETEVIPALGLRTGIAIIGDEAGNQITALFDFDFAFGRALLTLLATIADLLPLPPEMPIIEVLEWKTNILQSRNGKETRIALRRRPRRMLRMSMLVQNDAEHKQIYDKFYKTAQRSLIVPTYQYQSRLKRKTIITDNKLYTNPRRADLRVGEDVYVRTLDGTTFVFEVASVEADHVVITTAFSQEIGAGAIVCGAFNTRHQTPPSISMSSISGKADISVMVDSPRDEVAWPGYSATIPVFKNKPLLLRRPLATQPAESSFDNGFDNIDNQTGRPQYFSPYTQPFVGGPRSYLIQSLFDQDELEFWRTFLDTIKGQQKSFYTPTYREDLVWKSDIALLNNEIVVVGTDYSSLYFASPSYQQIEIETSAGTFQCSVSGIEVVSGGTKLSLTPSIDADLSGAVVTRISYIMLARLATDAVTLAHAATHTTVDLSIRVVVQ